MSLARTTLSSYDWPRGVPSCSWVQISQLKTSRQGTKKPVGYVNGDRSHGFVLVSFELEIDDWLRYQKTPRDGVLSERIDASLGRSIIASYS